MIITYLSTLGLQTMIEVSLKLLLLLSKDTLYNRCVPHETIEIFGDVLVQMVVVIVQYIHYNSDGEDE